MGIDRATERRGEREVEGETDRQKRREIERAEGGMARQGFVPLCVSWCTPTASPPLMQNSKGCAPMTKGGGGGGARPCAAGGSVTVIAVRRIRDSYSKACGRYSILLFQDECKRGFRNYQCATINAHADSWPWSSQQEGYNGEDEDDCERGACPCVFVGRRRCLHSMDRIR